MSGTGIAGAVYPTARMYWSICGYLWKPDLCEHYEPVHAAAPCGGLTEINRKVTDEEYEEIVDYARFLGMSQVYIQEGGCVGESFIPPFNYEGIERNV